ncbi:hypothetical protein EBZ37_05860 [bacterium]|nr:hypothetical protein [bacterium]
MPFIGAEGSSEVKILGTPLAPPEYEARVQLGVSSMKKVFVLLGLSTFFLTGCQLQLMLNSAERKITVEDSSTGSQGDCDLPVVEFSELRFKFPQDKNTVLISKASGHFVVTASKNVYCITAPCPQEVSFNIENSSPYFDLLERTFKIKEYELRSPDELFSDYFQWSQENGIFPLTPRPWQLEYSANLIGISKDSIGNALVCRKNRKPDSIAGDCENFSDLLNHIRLTVEGGI